MQTFRIGKVQEQSYYAIRVFGIVHLIGAIGLIVLLDGPSDGLGGFSWFLIVAATLWIGFLTLRVVQARAGRIHGHYVLTRNAMAIVEPGRPRLFIRREDCTGVVPAKRALILRGNHRVGLKSASSSSYLDDLVTALGRTWWTGLYCTPLWNELFDRNSEGNFELKVDFRSVSDAREPLLIFAPKLRHRMSHGGALAACLIAFVLFSGLIYVIVNENHRFSGAPAGLIRVIVPCAMSGVGILASLAAFFYVLRRLIRDRAFYRTCLLSSRCLAVLDPGVPPRFYRSDNLASVNPMTGTLYFKREESFVAAPYFYGGVHYGLLRCLFNRWRPGAPVIPISHVMTGTNLIVNAIVHWFIACQFMGQVTSYENSESAFAVHWSMPAFCLPFVFLCYIVRRDFLRNLAVRIDVSMAPEPSPDDVAAALLEKS